jgi:hypothetical protein
MRRYPRYTAARKPTIPYLDEEYHPGLMLLIALFAGSMLGTIFVLFLILGA